MAESSENYKVGYEELGLCENYEGLSELEKQKLLHRKNVIKKNAST